MAIHNTPHTPDAAALALEAIAAGVHVPIARKYGLSRSRVREAVVAATGRPLPEGGKATYDPGEDVLINVAEGMAEGRSIRKACETLGVSDTALARPWEKRRAADAAAGREFAMLAERARVDCALSGAANVMALEAMRNGTDAHSVGIDQLEPMLRNGGHLVERINSWLWRLDDQTVTLADMMEAAHRIDADAALVGEAA